MDIYSSTVDYISNLPVIKGWNEIQDILRRLASVRPVDWQLPMVVCQSLDGSDERAIPACAAIACAQIGIILIDDMLDDDPRGEYHRIGEAQTANCAATFLSAGLEAILHSPARSETKLAAVQSLNHMILTTAFGQSLDCQNPADEIAYWHVVETKSAPFFGNAFYLGALFGNAPDAVSGSMEQIGRLYGEMIQIHDDLNDTMTVPANPDWTLGRSPLPILFAQLVDHPERQKFIELRRGVSNSDVLREAQNILIRCGAVSYCVDQLFRRFRAAQDILNGTPLPRRDMIEPVLDELVAPVYHLFEAMGNPLPDLATVEALYSETAE